MGFLCDHPGYLKEELAGARITRVEPLEEVYTFQNSRTLIRRCAESSHPQVEVFAS